MAAIHDLLRHLVVHGPARNDSEREQLLGLVDEDETAPAEGKRTR